MIASYISFNSGGKPKINQVDSFVSLFDPSSSEPSFKKQFEEADSKIKKQCPTIQQGALNNVHGSWYEWILSHHFWNHYCDVKSAFLVAKLPNITQFDIAELFSPKLKAFISDLREKVSDTGDVSLVTSNPDFVIAKTEISEPSNIDSKLYSPDSIQFLDSIYNSLIGKLDFDTLIGFSSVKTSFRPDRRLQIPHEGSLMKAIYAHLVTREWIIRPKSLKYYAIARSVNDADRNAFKTV